MDSNVRMRQNHYQTLGLKPTATEDEVAEGFVRAMRLPHLTAEVAQIGLAFNTLRNRAKRRAYDEALGLTVEPQSHVAPAAMSFRISGHFGAVGPASLAQLNQRRPQREAADLEVILPQLAIPEFLTAGANRKPSARVGKQVIQWKHPAFALGSLILGVVVIAAWAGANAADAAPKEKQSALTVALPPAKTKSNKVQVPVSSSSDVADPEFISPEVIERVHQRIQARASARRLAERGRSLESATSGAPEAIGEQAAAVRANMPLPNSVIARTIERIGYACGAVASAAAVDGDEPGTYKVTCTSGQSYQARPVGGRYHFKRW